MHIRIALAAATLAASPALADEDLIEQGFGLFQQNCRTCHVMAEGENRLGPSLHGVIGREVGTVEGFGYSGSLRSSTAVWDEEMLDSFIQNPDGVFPGNQMVYAGMPDADNRAALVAYIVSEGGDAEAAEADGEVGDEETGDEEDEAS